MRPFYQSVNGVQEPHNPNYKLVETTVYLDGKFIDIVYGETNSGNNQGLELYFKKEINGHFYNSRRYLEEVVPKKYLNYYEYLKQFVIDGEVKEGHKLNVELPNN